MSTTVAVRFNTDDRHKIEPLLDFVKTLDAVSSVEIANHAIDEKLEASMPSSANGFLTLAEIHLLYPNEWVLLADTQRQGIEILGGIVLLHEPSKRDMALKGRDLIKNHKHTTHFYTGKFPKRAKIGLMRRISQ